MLVNLSVVALAEKVELVFGQGRRKRIGIGELVYPSVVPLDSEPVRERLARALYEELEKSRRVELFHFRRRGGRLAQIDELAASGVYYVGADDDSAPALVHSEQVVRQAAARGGYEFEFSL